MEKSILDKMPDFVELSVIVARYFTTSLWRDDNLETGFTCFAENTLRIVASISQKCSVTQPVNQRTGLFAISSGTFRNNNSDRHAMRIHGQMYF